MWDACGTLNFHVIPDVCKNCLTGPFSTFMMSIFISSLAPMKSVFQSKRINLTGFRSAKKRRRAFMNEELDISLTISMCIALETRQVNSIAHRFLLAAPRVLRVTISNRPKVSIPIEVNGGPELSRSGEISAIYCISQLLLNLRHVTQLCIKDDIILLAPIAQYPPVRTARSVKNLS